MFRRLSEPLPLSEASLLALRPALNAPVLNMGFLPVGPARAAIVVFAEEWGGIGVAIGMRANEGGQVAVFRNQESIESDVTVSAAVEPALSEAERMGFLFDEDMVESAPEGQGRTQALALWGRLMGEIEMPPGPRAICSEPVANEPILDSVAHTAPVEALPELVLDDVADIEIPEIPLELETEIVVPSPKESPVLPKQAPPRPVAPPRPILSRFRQTEAASSSPVGGGQDTISGATVGGSTLGRIPLVRVRRGRDGVSRVSYLARLLSSF